MGCSAVLALSPSAALSWANTLIGSPEGHAKTGIKPLILTA